MKAGDVMRLLNITKVTLYRWCSDTDLKGRPQVPKIRRHKINTTHYIYNDDDVYSLIGRERKKNKWCVIYARVSRRDQIDLLDDQIVRLREFANKTGLVVNKVYSEVANGVSNDRTGRVGLHKMLYDVFNRNVDVVIVDSPDRLSLFGADVFVQMFRYFKTRLIFLNESPVDPKYRREVARDMTKAIKRVNQMYDGRPGSGNRSKEYYDSVEGEMYPKNDMAGVDIDMIESDEVADVPKEEGLDTDWLDEFMGPAVITNAAGGSGDDPGNDL